MPPRPRHASAARSSIATGEPRTDPAPVLELREHIAGCLEAFADGIPITSEASPAELYEAWVLFVFALARGALLAAPGQFAAAAAQELEARGAGAAWLLLIDSARAHVEERDAGMARFAQLADSAVSPELLARLLRWLGELERRARCGEEGVVRELGALHEALLGLAFERLAKPARRLRRSRNWLSPCDVLTWPVDVRAKRLQRELGLSKHTVDALGARLANARTSADVESALGSVFDPRVAAREAGRWVLRASGSRRQSGAHYTPWVLSLDLVERVLGPLVAALPAPRSQSLLCLRVCDPAMGAGAFLIAVARYLGVELVRAWREEGLEPPSSPSPHDGELHARARRAVVSACLRGVDKNPIAVSLARTSLSLFLGGAAPVDLHTRLIEGDALIGDVVCGAGDRRGGDARAGALHWSTRFADVFGRDNPGFDAIVGNPPWVAYVGRAAQPLDPELARYYSATNPAFKRYRTLHGLFVYRSATLLRRGGRLGLILPTSVADLAGYAATRSAHDALCRVDAELPDWADGAFEGVFQPCMALLSTRDAPDERAPGSAIWPLRNDEVGATGLGLLRRLARLTPLPRELFGERGFQTTEDDQAHLRRALQARPPCSVPLREGADIGEFRALGPQLFADPERLGARLRAPADWQKVTLLIRQTARFPIAALSDGSAFRNSILAGFESADFPAPLLLVLLNSSLLRWHHYTLQRDARQGMPQLKVGHLRALPAPALDEPRMREALLQLGRRLGEVNAGIDGEQRAALDALVNDAYRLDAAERELVSAWAALHPPPISRRRPPAPEARPAGLPAREF